ncbi:cysteine-rich protamine-like [Trichoplusia ni]|uniref:Cysteine-rich protamine-like n=1 Tax=Trichoplusia ni TaxID=7111 RepID=A0A7E5VB65_TRINI|nr:cysteine-rich protamine-like [Trichoplusia ni]XP_026725527.1 cysteine-rich protamine-like [Trichoplusia ni]
MAKCRRRRKMCNTRCRTKKGRFKRCGKCDRRYIVPQPCCKKRRRSCPRPRRKRCRPKRPSCRRPSRKRFTYRCRSKCGTFKRCRRCDRRYPIRRRRSCS